MKTKQKIIVDLIRNAGGEVLSNSGKYIKTTVPIRFVSPENNFLFIGRKGALRIGKVQTKSKSLSQNLGFICDKLVEESARLEALKYKRKPILELTTPEK